MQRNRTEMIYFVEQFSNQTTVLKNAKIMFCSVMHAKKEGFSKDAVSKAQ